MKFREGAMRVVTGFAIGVFASIVMFIIVILLIGLNHSIL